MGIYEKLLNVQLEVKARKEIRNDFGKFNYRNAEQIYEAAKPICKKHGVLLRLTDEVVEVAGKPYVKAIAEAIEVEPSGEIFAIGSCGWARIPDMKKGMDDSQLTGSSSSYARKYALGGLLLLDDNKDPDSMDNGRDEAKEEAMKKNQEKLDAEENWRLLNGNIVLIKASDGNFYELDRLSKKQLQSALQNPKFDGIRDFIELEISKK